MIVDLAMPTLASCDGTEGCITCGDVAVALTVDAVVGHDAQCHDAAGRTETVATELVGPVAPGDVLLVHAGVALELLTDKGQQR